MPCSLVALREPRRYAATTTHDRTFRDFPHNDHALNQEAAEFHKMRGDGPRPVGAALGARTSNSDFYWKRTKSELAMAAPFACEPWNCALDAQLGAQYEKSMTSHSNSVLRRYALPQRTVDLRPSDNLGLVDGRQTDFWTPQSRLDFGRLPSTRRSPSAPASAVTACSAVSVGQELGVSQVHSYSHSGNRSGLSSRAASRSGLRG
mmetsp:Transcript_57481/g.160015  ORF Transcript_57481/g.160015 Transcript_57481/m.160015 type:complete len:205 (+) Transcript_57481:56-670(+)